LAVITSVIASLNSQRVVELEEDRLLPHVEPSFDLKSRYGLVFRKRFPKPYQQQKAG
jgi:hypothetical protein